MSLLESVKTILLLAFRSLPLLIISFIGFLAIGLGNMGLFILFIGHALAVPIVTEMIHVATKNNTDNLTSYNDVTQLVPTVPSTGVSYRNLVNIMPSYWMAHISFFFGYLLTNAVDIYTSQPLDKNASPILIESRKSRAATIMSITIILLLVLSYLRISTTGVEQFSGIILAIVLLGFTGVGWYYLAKGLGARNSDIFGITVQMISQETAKDKPMTCVYSASNGSSPTR